LPKPDYFDVILVNERDEITEGCISNIAIECYDTNGQMYWKTPSLDSGLLNGCLRAHYIANKLVKPGVVTKDELIAAHQ
ncbi:hypothetical protein H4R34_006199, partial [Dimargaris verticillata]